jgi:hypothetical protein
MAPTTPQSGPSGIGGPFPRSRTVMLPPTLLLLCTSTWASFQVELQADIVQRRDVVDAGHQVVELVRILPPREEPWTMAVHVPDSWLDLPRSSGLSSQELISSSKGQIQTLVGAVQRDVPWARGLDPVQAAGLWAGLLRNSAYANPLPVSHYRGVLQPWEVLYDDQGGDTLSASITALLALEKAGVEGSLARYPTPTTGTGVAFGLVVEGQAPAAVDWAWPVTGVTPSWTLFPLHLKARPIGALEASALKVWSLAELRAPGWSPGAAPAPGEPREADELPGSPPHPEGTTEPDPPQPAPAPPPRRAPQLDICAQAEAMGLECRPVDRSNDPLYLGLSVLALLGLAAAGLSAWLAQMRRQAQARARQQRREAEGF